MNKPNILKSLLLLAGTLVVGALGSGLWEVAFKPVLYWVGNSLLDISTLGLTSLRDGLYEEIARGNYERAGEKSYVTFVGLLLGLSAGAILAVIIRSRRAQRDERTVPRFLGLFRHQGVFILINVAFAVLLLVQSAKLVYVNRAANHVEQLQRIIAPYISIGQRLIYASRVAQMRTR